MFVYSATITGNQTDVPLVTNETNRQRTSSGFIVDIQISGGTDTSMDVTISDDNGNVLAVTGVNSQAGVNYRVDSTDIIRNAVNGSLKATTANLTGNVIITVWVRPT